MDLTKEGLLPRDNPHNLGVLLAVLGLASCLAGLVADPICDAILLGGLTGLGTYTLSKLNVSPGPLAGWNLEEAGNAAALGEFGGAVAGGLQVGYGTLPAGVQKLIPTGSYKNPITALYGSLAATGLGYLTNQDSGMQQDFCSAILSMIKDPYSLIGSVCGLAPH